MTVEYKNTHGDVTLTYKVVDGEPEALLIAYAEPNTATTTRLKVTQLESIIKNFMVEAERLTEPFVAADRSRIEAERYQDELEKEQARKIMKEFQMQKSR